MLLLCPLPVLTEIVHCDQQDLKSILPVRVLGDPSARRLVNMVLEDPFQFVEDLDEQTMNYTRLNTQKFKSVFGWIDPTLKRRVEAYTETKTVLHSQVHGEHIINIFSEGEGYRVQVDERVIYSTRKVVQWVEAREDISEIAIFESSGSDAGTMKILKGGKQVASIEGNITQAVFTHTSHYIVKTFSDRPPPDGGELNSHRVLLGDKIVFGHGLKANEFIHMYTSGEAVTITVGDWNHSVIYSGRLDDPSTWKSLFRVNSPAKPLGIVDGKICYLERKGMGIIRKGKEAVVNARYPVEDCVVVREGFLVLHMRHASVSPTLYDFDGKLLHAYKLGEPLGLRSVDSDETGAVINMQSFGTPYVLYRFNVGKLVKVEENRLLDLNVSDRWTKSSGTDIHYFLVSKGGHKNKRALAYGYGGYNISLSPRFSPLFAIALENGVTVVQANLRGGGEYGEEWHKAGMREKKQLVFDDFISVIKALRRNKYSVVAMGESNGGLLVGSVLTQRPELLNGALIGVPVLDMLRFHLMSVGKYWTTEYGNPDNPDDAKFLSEYSPYHNIKNTSYPAVLLYSRLKDDRVHPAHAIKFHMRLSRLNPEVYLRVNPSGGHAGLSVKERTLETCENFNFISACLNRK